MNKVREIIDRDFDSRACGMVLGYLLDKGLEFCRQITDKDISEVEGNGLMTEAFAQKLVEVSRTVARECDETEIFDYIQTELNPKNRVRHLEIWRDDIVSESIWQEICDELDEEYDVISIEGDFILNEED